jgi:hypothetical protein
LTCVVDHDTGRLVWAAEGRNSETILKFFDALGEDRAKKPGTRRMLMCTHAGGVHRQQLLHTLVQIGRVDAVRPLDSGENGGVRPVLPRSQRRQHANASVFDDTGTPADDATA